MPFKSGLSKMVVAVSFFAMVGSAWSAIPKHATNLGPENQSKQIEVTVWLNLHNKPALDALVKQMYDKDSPNYHHFLTLKDYKAKFGPTAKDAAMVRSFLAANHLTVTSSDKHNHFITARGRVADMQSAFNTQINRVMVNGAMHRANTREASIAGPAASV